MTVPPMARYIGNVQAASKAAGTGQNLVLSCDDGSLSSAALELTHHSGLGTSLVAKALIIKDTKTFLRDPSQWSQTFPMLSLIAIYLSSVQALPVDVVGTGYMQDAKNALAYVNLGMVGFVMAGIAVRFQYAVISGEGGALWMMRTAPEDPER